MERIKVVISADGQGFSLDAVGFKGSGCKAKTKFLEELGKSKELYKKPEYHLGDDNKNMLTRG